MSDAFEQTAALCILLAAHSCIPVFEPTQVCRGLTVISVDSWHAANFSFAVGNDHP